MKFQAVIFDLFGTIVDGFATSSAGYQEQFAAALGLPHDQLSQHWRQLTDRRTLGEFQTVEDSIEHVCSLVGATVTAKQIMKAAEIRLNLTRHALTPRPDAIATLDQLKRDGLKIGLLSNCSIEIPILWPETEFADLIESPIFSSRERLKKPDRRIYQIACERLDVAPEECLYVADGENHELKAAADFGMNPVLILPKLHEPRGDMRQEAREWQGLTISALAEVLQLTDKTSTS